MVSTEILSHTTHCAVIKTV